MVAIDQGGGTIRSVAVWVATASGGLCVWCEHGMNCRAKNLCNYECIHP